MLCISFHIFKLKVFVWTTNTNIAMCIVCFTNRFVPPVMHMSITIDNFNWMSLRFYGKHLFLSIWMWDACAFCWHGIRNNVTFACSEIRCSSTGNENCILRWKSYRNSSSTMYECYWNSNLAHYREVQNFWTFCNFIYRPDWNNVICLAT